MSEKHPVQASGNRDAIVRDDGVSVPHGRSSPGESGGGSYPNPCHGKKRKGWLARFLGHGGQSVIGYHGTGQLGKDVVDEQSGAREAATKDDS